MAGAIFAVPDTHFPYVAQSALDETLREIERLQPSTVIQMGDLYDLYAFGSHPRILEGLSPKNELAAARCGAEAFWGTVKHVAPGATRYQLTGNHDLRIRKRVKRVAPEIDAVLDICDFDSLWRFPGVESIPYREPLEVGGIVFHHGWKKFGEHMRHFLKPTVCGHLHRGDVEFMQMWGKTIWELNCGYLGDFNSIAFTYPETQVTRWTLGYGLIDERGPRFVAL